MPSHYHRVRTESARPRGDTPSPALILRVGMLCCAIAIVIALAAAVLS